MSRKRNTFSKAVKHLKSSKIEEKLQTLNEIPTMNTSGLYDVVPGALSRTEIDKNNPTVPDYTGIDWDIDGEDGRDTSGLFDSEGNSLFVKPPGDNSYILGPMASMFYNYAYNDWTMIGYIRESDRRFMNLGYLYQNRTEGSEFSGRLEDWDGVNDFNSYGQLTLEQALWFRDTPKKGGTGSSGHESSDFRAFYPGPPSSTPDAFGRYYCTITGTPIATKDNEKEVNPIELQSSDVLAALMDRLSKLGYSKLSKREKKLLNKLGYLDTGEEGPQDDSQGDDTQQKSNNWDKFKDTLSKIGKGLWTAAEIVTGSKAAEMISDLVFEPIIDAAFGLTTAKNAGEFNTKLATSLMTTVVTGKNQQIHLSKEARIDLINNVDVKELEKYLKIGPPPEIGSDNAIKPGDGKSDTLLKGAWGNQGGVEINYDPNTGTLTITSSKMLRDFGNLDKKNADGKITNFHDIPNPTTDQVKNLFKQKGMEGPLKSFYNMVANAEIKTSVDAKGIKPFSAGYDPEAAAEMMYDGLPEVTKALYNFAVEGSASNAVHLRNYLIKAGVPKSEIEKAGAGFGGFVYSKAEYTGADMPKNLKKVVNKLTLKSMGQDYSFLENTIKPKRKLVSESRKTSILKNLKNPVVLPESKKKHKVKPGQRYKGKTNFQGMDKLIGDIKPQEPFKKERSAWSKDWQGYNAKLSQNKKNEVLELVGDGKQAFDYMLNDSKIKNAQEMEKFWGLNPELYSYVFNGKKYKETRKEQVRGDYLVFLTDENGEKISMLQSDISIKLAEEHEKELFAEYNKTAEPTPFLKDPLMKKVAKRLKNEIDYPDKPAKKGYPDEPPPKQVNGWHPEYGKKYKYDKLDPVSAVMMKRAPTGDPEIDANVKKASMKPKVEKKSSNWREELEV